MSQQIGIVSNTTDLGVMVTRNLMIKLVRQNYPDARLILITERAIAGPAREFHRQASWIDEYVAIESQQPHDELECSALCRQVRSWRLDMIILSPWSKLPCWVPYRSGVPVRVGLPSDERQEGYLTHPVNLDRPSCDRDLHWSHILAGYTRALGIRNFQSIAQHVPFFRLDHNVKGNWPNLTGCKVAVHVGGNAAWNRRWPLSNFIHICQRLIGETDASIFLVGSADEAPDNAALVEEVRRVHSKARVFNLSGASIQVTGLCIAQSNVFIGNDSGPMNVAVALGTPVIAIRGADPENFRPDLIDSRHIVISAWHHCDRFINGSQQCTRNCPVAYDRDKQEYPKCMAAISPDSVWRAIIQLLQGQRCHENSFDVV
jgi:ADP-heptose:LPS heptosyltransferase